MAEPVLHRQGHSLEVAEAALRSMMSRAGWGYLKGRLALGVWGHPCQVGLVALIQKENRSFSSYLFYRKSIHHKTINTSAHRPMTLAFFMVHNRKTVFEVLTNQYRRTIHDAEFEKLGTESGVVRCKQAESQVSSLNMKIGIIISLVLVLVVGGIVFLALNTPPDGPSSKTNEAQLALQTLPTDLPELVPAPKDGPGDAKATYEKLIAYYQENARQLDGRTPPKRMVTSVTNMLIEASEAGYAGQGFLDDRISVVPGSDPSFGAAMEVIPIVALNQALESDNVSNTRKVAYAVWNMGRRAFEKGSHLYVRRQGLNMMQLAGSALYQVNKDDKEAMEALQAWSGSISSIINNWDGKIQIIQSVRQPVGDLLNIAKNDEDKSFRIAATSWLGVAKFNPGHRGNEKGITSLIESSKTNDDALIAKAANAADSFTREDLRKLH